MNSQTYILKSRGFVDFAFQIQQNCGKSFRIHLYNKSKFFFTKDKTGKILIACVFSAISFAENRFVL